MATIPVVGRFTDAFGPRGYVAGIGYLGFHSGQDIAAPLGTPVRAWGSGIVRRIWWDAYANGLGAGGWMIAIDHGGAIETRYAHLQHRPTIAVGSFVAEGAVIGLVGATGAATGPHLHIEFWVHGRSVNPYPYLTQATIPEPPPPTPMETDMKLIKVVQPTGTTWALLGLGFFQETRDVKQANAWAEVWGDAVPVSDLAWEQAYNAALLGQAAINTAVKGR